MLERNCDNACSCDDTSKFGEISRFLGKITPDPMRRMHELLAEIAQYDPRRCGKKLAYSVPRLGYLRESSVTFRLVTPPPRMQIFWLGPGRKNSLPLLSNSRPNVPLGISIGRRYVLRSLTSDLLLLL